MGDLSFKRQKPISPSVYLANTDLQSGGAAAFVFVQVKHPFQVVSKSKLYSTTLKSLIGALNKTSDVVTGQCFCKQRVASSKCDTHVPGASHLGANRLLGYSKIFCEVNGNSELHNAGWDGKQTSVHICHVGKASENLLLKCLFSSKSQQDPETSSVLGSTRSIAVIYTAELEVSEEHLNLTHAISVGSDSVILSWKGKPLWSYRGGWFITNSHGQCLLQSLSLLITLSVSWEKPAEGFTKGEILGYNINMLSEQSPQQDVPVMMCSKRAPAMIEDLRTGYMGEGYSDTADSIGNSVTVESKKLKYDTIVKISHLTSQTLKIRIL
ncbi:hypothetical protein ACRRTK_005175 [Alexandromys fortis]